jgi:hypothetical protein
MTEETKQHEPSRSQFDTAFQFKFGDRLAVGEKKKERSGNERQENEKDSR